MLKIGIDIRLIGKKRTGDEAVFFNLVKNLAQIDNRNEYFLFTDRDPYKNPDLAEEIGKLELKDNFKVITLNSPNRFWWNLWVLPAYLQKNPVDIFHTQYIAPFWLPKEVKLVLMIHDISFNFFPQFIKFSDLFFLKTLIPRSLKMATKIITVSKSERKNILDFYKMNSGKVEFVYNGVDFERFGKKYSDEEKEKIRKKYQLPEKFLLYIGTLQPRKNIPVLVKAIEKLNIELVLAGNKNAHNFDKKIDELINKNNLRDKIIFPGWIDEEDKPVLLQLASCFVFPSLYEGFGIPLIEAMAAGTSIVCSDIPVLREVGGDAALYADPKNIQEFANKLGEILKNSDLRNETIAKGKKVAQKFTWQKNAKEILEIYQTLTD
jgi:glycosyltransferase involved in cell wall biosynthesis